MKYFTFIYKNPFKTIRKLKGVFKSPKLHFKCGRNNWYPIFWWNKPNLFHIYINDVEWKDKYETPRYEGPPCIWISILGLNFIWYWAPENGDIEDYWEQVLWYLYYYNNISYGSNEPNIEKAKESWPWIDYETNKSTWNDKFLIK